MHYRKIKSTMCFLSRILFVYLGSISQLAPFSHADDFDGSARLDLGQ